MQAWPFYDRPSLHVETYDELAAAQVASSPVAGDVDFYRRLAAECGGPVLELGCGTGRVAWALAEAGHEVVGLDASAPMLGRAAAKAASCSSATCGRARFVPGDMAAFSLGEELALAITPFRSFMSLLEPERQRACLRCVRRHLRPGGLVVLDLFDPRLEYLLPGVSPPAPPRSVTHPVSGNAVTVSVVEREVDPLRQRLREVWELAELSPAGEPLRVEREELRLRWTWRWEARYLLELAGFDVVAEHGDFRGSPPAPGQEQVWVARRRD